MLTNFTFYNVDGTHSIELNSDIYPFSLFEPTIEQRTDKTREKMERDGVWPTKSNRGGMELHVEGSILADDSAGYVTNRKALVLALFGVPDVIVTDDKMGTLQVGLAGETEDWQTDVTIDLFSAPIRALYPAVGEYGITFYSFTPWFTGVTSGDKIYWS